MYNGTQIRHRAVWLITAALLAGIVTIGDAVAQVPIRPTGEPEEKVSPGEQVGEGMRNVAHKFGRGFLNMVKAPADIPAAVYYRASAERPRYWGFAVVSSPLEGAAQGAVRMGMGLLEMLLAPFPPYDVPFYEYDLGACVADPALAKAGFGLYHIASSPIDIPAAVVRRVNGEKPAHSGFAVAFSPFEGAVQGLTRSGVGMYYLASSPFPKYPAEPPYRYEFGLSPIDKAIEGFMRGGENIEISPLELPVTMHHAVMDRGMVYGPVYGFVMGPTRMMLRLGAGLLEMTTCGAPDFEPVYEVELGESLPDMFREQPRLKRPVHQPIR